MNTTAVIRVLVVDDHFMVRRGLMVALGVERDIKVVAEAADSVEALAEYRKHSPEVVLMDWRLPGLNGSEATAALLEEFPDARVAILSAQAGDEQAHTAVQAGARGYILKSADRSEIVAAIRQLHAGGRYFPPEIAVKLAACLHKQQLSSREREVLLKAAAGRTNKEIADGLGIAETTVKVFMGRIFNKLDARDRAHAVLIAIQRGIIDPN